MALVRRDGHRLSIDQPPLLACQHPGTRFALFRPDRVSEASPCVQFEEVSHERARPRKFLGLSLRRLSSNGVY
jgi:hypothetical protein